MAEERILTCENCPKKTKRQGRFPPTGWVFKLSNLHGEEHLCSEPCNIALSEKRLREATT